MYPPYVLINNLCQLKYPSLALLNSTQWDDTNNVTNATCVMGTQNRSCHLHAVVDAKQQRMMVVWHTLQNTACR